jgi:hypothetical protein
MNLWRLWAKSIGEKSGSSDKEADSVAIIRTLIFLTYFMTNIFIIAGVIRHWNDNLNSDTVSISECQRQSLKQVPIIPLEVSPFRP